MEKRTAENEKTLYKRFFRGERSAVEEIAEIYREGLVLFINGYLRDFTASEDLASETLATLIVKKPKLKNGTHFKTYLFTMAKNTALSWLRKNKRILQLDENAPLAVDENIEESLLCAEEKKTLLLAMNGLSAEYRSVLILRYWEELSPEKIAKVTGKSKKQVYNLLQRAKSSLKTALEKEGFAYEID